MQEEFGSDPSEIYGAVGPSICQDCYEVSEDVIEQFRAAFPQDKWDALFYGKPDGKYQLDLWEANHQIMLGAGLKEEHISMPKSVHLLQSGIPFFAQGFPWQERKSGGISGDPLIRYN